MASENEEDFTLIHHHDPIFPGSPRSDGDDDSNPTGFYSQHNPYYFKRLKPSSSDPDSRKDREEWSDSAISSLLDAYAQRYMVLNRGNLRGRDWDSVAFSVSQRCEGSSKSIEQCKNKIDNLKKRYKVEVQRCHLSGVDAESHWHWFKRIEAIVGNSPKCASDEDRFAHPLRQSKRNSPSNITLPNNTKVKQLTNIKWRRVMFKISGAALAANHQNIDAKVALQIATEVALACCHGVEVAIVVGGSNFFCGKSWVSDTGMDRTIAYQTGMMATVMNSLLLQSALEKLGIETRVQSTFILPEVSEPYCRQRAIRHLEKGRVVIFGGIGAGVGNPLFSTDTAAALRASEINADAVLKGTNVNDGVSCLSDDNNVIVDHILFKEALSRGINTIDIMAMTYCEENGIPVVVFNLLEPGNISRALCGDHVGILIDQS